MSGWTKARDAILQQKVAQTGVGVLVVEGEDDRLFFEMFLELVAPGQWESGWCVGAAGGKRNVLSILEDQQTWIGVVDRDEWAPDSQAQAVANFGPRLHVLPRYCMESYFIDPNELWETLPPAQQTRIAGGKPALEARIITPLSQWVRHGALWHAVNPLWDGLRAIGFKDALLDLPTSQDDSQIRQTLREWHDFLDPDRIFGDFQNNLAQAQRASRTDQLKTWVHGKRFFTSHVVPCLNALLDQKSADDWMNDLRRTLRRPADLSFLTAAMQLP
jgi:hypothetical protein